MMEPARKRDMNTAGRPDMDEQVAWPLYDGLWRWGKGGGGAGGCTCRKRASHSLVLVSEEVVVLDQLFLCVLVHVGQRVVGAL